MLITQKIKIFDFIITFLEREDKNTYFVKISISHHTYCVFYKKINFDASRDRIHKKIEKSVIFKVVP